MSSIIFPKQADVSLGKYTSGDSYKVSHSISREKPDGSAASAELQSTFVVAEDEPEIRKQLVVEVSTALWLHESLETSQYTQPSIMPPKCGA